MSKIDFINSPYPNPFNPSTVFRFGIKNQSIVNLIIFDITGKTVSKIIKSEYFENGVYERSFNAAGLPSGVYFYYFDVESQFNKSKFSDSGKLLLVK